MMFENTKVRVDSHQDLGSTKILEAMHHQDKNKISDLSICSTYKHNSSYCICCLEHNFLAQNACLVYPSCVKAMTGILFINFKRLLKFNFQVNFFKKVFNIEKKLLGS